MSYLRLTSNAWIDRGPSGEAIELKHFSERESHNIIPDAMPLEPLGMDVYTVLAGSLTLVDGAGVAIGGVLKGSTPTYLLLAEERDGIDSADTEAQTTSAILMSQFSTDGVDAHFDIALGVASSRLEDLHSADHGSVGKTLGPGRLEAQVFSLMTASEGEEEMRNWKGTLILLDQHSKAYRDPEHPRLFPILVETLNNPARVTMFTQSGHSGHPTSSPMIQRG